jgi:hypothetical protein
MPQSPGLLLAVLIALLATQVARIALPERAGPYLVTLGLSAAGVAVAELIAGFGHLTGPSVGVVHPFLDVVLVAAFQAVGLLLAGQVRGGPSV